MTELAEISAACADANRIADRLRGVPARRRPKESRMTYRQTEVMKFMKDFLARNDEVPPMWAIAAHFGWASANAASEHVAALARLGVVERNEIGNWRFVRGEA